MTTTLHHTSSRDHQAGSQHNLCLKTAAHAASKTEQEDDGVTVNPRADNLPVDKKINHSSHQASFVG